MKAEQAGTGGLKAAAFALAVGCILFFPTFLGRVPAFADNVSFWAPNTAWWTAQVKDGYLPLWNPYTMGGTPFAADINHGLFYPPHWAALFLGTAAATAVLLVLHAALAVLGAYLLLGELEVPPPAALWGGAAFALAEGFVSLANHVVMFESMAWLPMALYLVARLTDGGGLRSALYLGAVVALSALAGDVHATYIIAVGAGVLWIARVVRLVRRRKPGAAGSALIRAVVAAVTATLLAAVALIPAYELVSGTARGEGAVDYASYHSIDLTAAAGMVIPGLWGAPAAGTVWNFRWGSAAYLGIVVLALAAWSLRRPARAATPLALAAVGVGFAFGAASPLWRIAHAWLPGFRMFRQPREFLILAAAGVVMLAAMGLGDLLEARKAGGRQGRMRLTAIVATLVVAVAAAAGWWWRDALALHMAEFLKSRVAQGSGEAGTWVTVVSAQAALAAAVAGLALLWRKAGILAPRVAAAAIAIVALADYGLLARNLVPYGPPEVYEPPAKSAGVFSASGTVRVAPLAPGLAEYFEAFAGRRITGVMRGEEDGFATLLRAKSCLVDNEAMYVGAGSVLGYSTFVPARYAALYKAATGLNASPVRLVAVDGADWRLLGAGVAVPAVGEWQLGAPYALEGSWVWMASDWRCAGDFADAQRLLQTSPSMALGAPVVEGLDRNPSRQAAVSGRWQVENVRRTASSLSFDLYTDDGGLLVVSENNHRGWVARLNGARAPLYTANLTWRALLVDPGRYKVEFLFRPSGFFAAAGVSAIALCLFAAAWLGLRQEGGG